LLAPAAVVVRPPDLHFAMHRQPRPLLVGVELRRVRAVRAGHAAPDVPLFFRLATLACRTSLTKRCPASRNSRSMAPNSSASGLADVQACGHQQDRQKKGQGREETGEVAMR
jgi:hypothetical protein